MKKILDDELPFEALQKAVGLPLTETEERYLRWLARYDIETIDTFIGLFEKIKKESQITRRGLIAGQDGFAPSTYINFFIVSKFVIFWNFKYNIYRRIRNANA